MHETTQLHNARSSPNNNKTNNQSEKRLTNAAKKKNTWLSRQHLGTQSTRPLLIGPLGAEPSFRLLWSCQQAIIALLVPAGGSSPWCSGLSPALSSAFSYPLREVEAVQGRERAVYMAGTLAERLIFCFLERCFSGNQERNGKVTEGHTTKQKQTD